MELKDNMKDYNFEIFRNEKIINFMSENEINKLDLMPYIAEIKMYLEDIDSYVLLWDDMVILEKKKVCVIEEEIYKQLFDKDVYPIGTYIKINNINYKCCWYV